MNGEGVPADNLPPSVTYQDRKDNWEAVTQLKESILQQLERGECPESVLYDALQALGMATNDPEYAEKGASFLSGDKVELSFFADLEEMQAKREARREAYYSKRRKDIDRQLKQLEADQKTLMQELQQVQQALPFADRVKKIL
jgi:hypothetical protein